MAVAAFLFATFLASSVTITSSYTVTTESPEVTVRRGEQLQMSCDVGIDSGETPNDITEVRWERRLDASEASLYGLIDLSSCVGICVDANTTDGRGIVTYSAETLTINIESSRLEDNTTFRCAVYKGNTRKSALITVAVYYLPNTTYPTCSAIMPSLLHCSAEKTQPVVSLEWTASVDSTRVVPSNKVIVGNQVVNTLHLHTLDASYNNSIFTCYMTSEAYPDFNQTCSIGPLVIPTVTNTTTSAETTKTESGTSDRGQLDTVRPTSQAAVTGTLSQEIPVCPFTTTKVTTTHPDINTHSTGFSIDEDLGTDAKTLQPTPPQSSPSQDTTPLAAVTPPIVIIASAGAAVVLVILVLLIIIGCLVASRRRGRKNRPADETRFAYENHEVAAANQSNDHVNRYENFPLDHLRPTAPPAPPTHDFAPADPPTDSLPSSKCVSPPGYAAVTPRNQRKQSLNPESGEPSPEIAHGVYASSSVIGAGAGIRAGITAGTTPPEYAAYQPSSQQQPPQYAVLNPDSGEPSPEIAHGVSAYPFANSGDVDETAGASIAIPEYAMVQRGSQRQPAPPEYVVMNPENDEISSETSEVGSGKHRCTGAAYDKLKRSGVERPQSFGSPEEAHNHGKLDEGENLRSIAAPYPDLGYAEVGPGFIPDWPKMDPQDADRDKEEEPKGEHQGNDHKDADKFLCLVSPDDTLISEKSLGEIDLNPKKKKKGKDKPRLDPF